MKKLLIAVAILASVSAYGNTQKQDADSQPANTNGLVKLGRKWVTREYVRDVIKRASEKRTGGFVRQANTAKGWFVILNNAPSAASADIDAAVKTLDKQVKVQIRTVAVTGVTQKNIQAEIAKAGASCGIALVEDVDTPSLLSAPEDNWAMVNVSKLKTDNPDAETFGKRVRAEILRAFGFVAGGAYSAHGDFVMRIVQKPSDLDDFVRLEYSVSMLQTLSLTTPYYGLVPWHQTTYLRACEEGWAPAPTNDVQKAIWEKVHAVPDKPITIEFDPKKDK
jgi:hypothetical protein